MSTRREDGGDVPWAPIIGGIAIGAGILAFLYFFGKSSTNLKKKNEEDTCCDFKIDPAKRKWPLRANADSGGGITAWLPIIGGVAIGAGLIALAYKLISGRKNKDCPVIDPTRRRWPKEKKSWYQSK